jgi:sulfotransferase family protein
MLCQSRELVYVHEPFNPGLWPRWFPTPLPYRNLYVCAENEATYLDPVAAVLARRTPKRGVLQDRRRPADVARFFRHVGAREVARIRRGATLVKDPIALFSAPWLAQRFDLDVVVMIRQPVAYAGSIVRLRWAFDFRNWRDQPLLMRDLLAPYEREINAMADSPGDLIDQAILRWNAQYHAVDQMRRGHPNWLFVNYEELASEPHAGYVTLFEQLGLRFNSHAARQVQRYSSEHNVKEVPTAEKGTLRRDSRAALDTWRHRLSEDDVRRVVDGTAEVADRLARHSTSLLPSTRPDSSGV